MARDSFPRQQARTRNFTLGAPASFAIAGDGSRVVFLRSRAGDDPVACLWAVDLDTGAERLVFDPHEHARESEAHLTQEELDRRERVGERHTGVTSYAIDENARSAVFAFDGGLRLVDLTTGETRSLDVAPAPFDPRLDPTGSRVAYVAGGALRVFYLESGSDRELAADPDLDVHWGIAEFVAAEEMDRQRGYWWSPDGTHIAAARVDEGPVEIWHIPSPIDPAKPPRAVRYPRAGTANAIVTMSVFSIDGGRVDVAWDLDAFPYLARVDWGSHGPLTLLVQSRDQRAAQVLAVDHESGATKVVREDHDDYWLHLVDGVPAWLPGGRLLTTIHDEDTRRLAIDGEPVSPVGLQVNSVLDAGDEVVFLATDDPTEMQLFRLNLVTGELERDTKEPGVHAGAASGRVTVVATATIERSRHSFTVTRDGPPIEVRNDQEDPLLQAEPTFFTSGERGIRCALLTPKDTSGKLPVLLDPYGGPHFNMVVRSYRYMLEHQWWADQGFAVLVADGRGTAYRSLGWEREVHHELADRALQDQVDALHDAAERHPFMDLSRVAIRGWSFGGYLTCLALLRRPDVFHAGVSGAPVTDVSLYDTFYMERYLGDPKEFPEVYERNSVIKDAPNLEGKLMLVHGISDDNVYVANTLALSKALMEAGRPHTVLPLSGITHRPTDESVAENLLMLELSFLKDALGMP